MNIYQQHLVLAEFLMEQRFGITGVLKLSLSFYSMILSPKGRDAGRTAIEHTDSRNGRKPPIIIAWKDSVQRTMLRMRTGCGKLKEAMR